MPETPMSPVEIELATLDMRRGAAPAVDRFLAALKAEMDAQVVILLGADSESVRVAQGAAVAVHKLLERMQNAKENVARYESAVRKNKDRAQ